MEFFSVMIACASTTLPPAPELGKYCIKNPYDLLVVNFRFVLICYWIVALFKLLVRKWDMMAAIFLTISVTVCSRLRCRIRNFRYIYKYDCMEMTYEGHFRSSSSLEITFVVSSSHCMVRSHCACTCILALRVCVVFSYCVSYSRIVCVCVISAHCMHYPRISCCIRPMCGIFTK
jgi:hypothetical protein